MSTEARYEWVNIISVKGTHHFMPLDQLKQLCKRGVEQRIAVYATMISREVGRVVDLELRGEDLYAKLEMDPSTPHAPRAAGFVAIEHDGRPRLIAVFYTDFPRDKIALLGEMSGPDIKAKG